MTSQNPASPNSQNPKLDRDILAKVNAHADRSLDRLFADIDGLLGGDLDEELNTPTHHRNAQSTHNAAAWHPDERQPQASLPSSDFTSSRSAIDTEAPSQPIAPQQKKQIPTWLKLLLGISATSLAVGGGMLWLVNERKIELPKNIDTSWLPFQSNGRVAPEDAKFAEYMQKSIAKIDAAKTETPATTAPTTAIDNTALAPAPATAPSIIDPAGTITATPSTEQATITTTPISLLKTFPASKRPQAIFKIDGRDLAVTVGQKIGTSKWSVLSVAKGEVILKKVGGEIRSIYVGQKF